MPKGSRLRVTGDLPTAAQLRRYPNWEHALDEEGLEGQDETTLRPSKTQRSIATDSSVVGTRVEGPARRIRDGVAMGGFNDLSLGEGEVEELWVFDGKACLGVTLHTSGGWWWPVEYGDPLGYNDFERLPLRHISRTPSAKLRRRLQFVLMPDGQLRTGKRAAKLEALDVRRLRPGDVLFHDTGHVADIVGRQFDMIGAKRRPTGETSNTYKWIDGGKRLRVEVRSNYENADGVMTPSHDSWECDARTLECVAFEGAFGDKRFKGSVGSKGSAILPRGTTPLFSLLLPALDVAKGRMYVMPWYSPMEQRIRPIWYVVEAREKAPESGVISWRIADYMGGATKGLSWYDAATFRPLARRFFSRFKKSPYDRLTLYR